MGHLADFFGKFTNPKELASQILELDFEQVLEHQVMSLNSSFRDSQNLRIKIVFQEPEMQLLIKYEVHCEKLKKSRILEEIMLSRTNQMYYCSVNLRIKFVF